MGKIFFYVCIGLILFLCLLINVDTLYNGHNWGGDFSQYIIHARNIIEGNNYGNGIMLDNPVVYPPGYPLMIAPLIKAFGINFKILKLLNVFFWYAALFPIFMIMSKRLGKDIALLFILFLATSSNFFVFKQNILSDIPFYCFVNYTIYYFVEHCALNHLSTPKEVAHFILFIVLMSCSFLIRSAGIILFAAAIVYYFFINKDLKKSLIILLSWGGVFALQVIWMGIHKGFFSQIIHDPAVFLMRSLKNSPIVFKSLFWFFCPGQTVLTEKLFSWGNVTISFMAPIIYCVIAGVFIYQASKKNLSYIGIFFLFYLSVLVVWSGFRSDIQGFVRFVYPIIVFSFMFLYEVFGYLINKIFSPKDKGALFKIIVKIFLTFLIFVNIFNIYGIYQFNDDVLYRPENVQLFQWIRDNTQPDDHYMIWRPRPVALLTNRIGTVPWREDLRENISVYQRVKDLKIAYLIFSKYVDQDLIFSFKRNSGFSKAVWENETYIIFRVL